MVNKKYTNIHCSLNKFCQLTLKSNIIYKKAIVFDNHVSFYFLKLVCWQNKQFYVAKRCSRPLIRGCQTEFSTKLFNIKRIKILNNANQTHLILIKPWGKVYSKKVEITLKQLLCYLMNESIIYYDCNLMIF